MTWIGPLSLERFDYGWNTSEKTLTFLHLPDSPHL